MLIEQRVAELVRNEDWEVVNELCRRLGHRTETRITVIQPSGEVVGDSHEDPDIMENHAERPEIKEALEGKEGSSRRFSATLERKMMYYAIPVRALSGEDEKPIAVVRTSVPLTSIDRTLSSLHTKIFWGAVIVAILLAGLSLYISRRITLPLDQMKHGAQKFARGELDQKLPIPRSEEFAALAESLNEMASQLDDQIHTIVRQRNEREAILSSMTEGVIAVDVEGRVLAVNDAGEEILKVDAQQARGRVLEEVIRVTELQDFVRRTLDGDLPLEDDIILQDEQERVLQAHGTALEDAQGREIGALIVMNDVTRLRRLERIRRDFVANVSHELKTPITAIKGFIETLQTASENDPEKTRRFLKIVGKQADRLGAIVEDLLALSRIEQNAQKSAVERHTTVMKDLLANAVQDCMPKAREKNIEVLLECQEDLKACINSALLEQAVVNLLDNAIKYSEEGGKVKIQGSQADGGIEISVSDEGCGIPKEHLGRLFERFYRVDKARSRKLGGTGLGLAIVKHIAQVHAGTIDVESSPGEGSTFFIRIPV
ncbi:MAG: two-component system histidine kinase PnpS [Candidatus Brocadiia bacterium]